MNKSSLKTANHHREGIYTTFKLQLSALTEVVQWIETFISVLTYLEGPGSNPLKVIFRDLIYYFFFFFFTLLFTGVVHIASNIMW